MLGSRVVYDPSSSPNASPRARPLNLSRSRSRSTPRLGRPVTRIANTDAEFNQNGKTQLHGDAQHVPAGRLVVDNDRDAHGDVKKPNQHVPNERSPLLRNEVDEQSNGATGRDAGTNWRDELRVLISYTLPVLGYALHFI